MVMRASPGVEAVAVGTTSGPDVGGGAAVSTRRAPALSPSSARSPSLCDGDAWDEESLCTNKNSDNNLKQQDEKSSSC